MKKYTSEFIASLIFTFIGVGAAAILMTLGQIAAFTAIALSFGLAFTIMYATFGKISGAQINPAISVAMLINGKLSVKDFIGYIIAQFAGAFAGCGLVVVIYSNCKQITDGGLLASLKSQAANHYDTLSIAGTGMWAAIIIEAIVAFAIVMTYISATSNKKTKPFAGILVGLAITVTTLFTLSFTGAAANPAKSLAAAVFAGKDSLVQVWIFIVAPLVGGALAALVWSFMSSDDEADEDDEELEIEFADDDYEEDVVEEEIVDEKADF